MDKVKRIITLSFLFFVLVFGVSGCKNNIAVNNDKTTQKEINNQEKTKKKEESPDIDTSDWKTYRNEEYGFEFKYPKNWKGAPDGWKDALIIKIINFKNLTKEQLLLKKNIEEKKAENLIPLNNHINGQLSVYYTTIKKDERNSILNELLYGVKFFLNNNLIEIAVRLPRNRNYNLPSEIKELNLFIDKIKSSKSEDKIDNMIKKFNKILNTFIFLKK